MTEALVKYETDKGSVELSPSIVRQYLVSGNGKVTDGEIKMFVELCRYQQLNPFLREAYLIKFGNHPATLVVGKDVMTKRAAHNESCAGFEAGIMIQDANGDLTKRAGTMLLEGEKLVGGWADVYRHDWDKPLEHTVALKEFQRWTTKNGKTVLMANWQKMPGTMIRKVAMVQALREAFPDDLQGLYDADEMPVDASAIKTAPVTSAADHVDEKGAHVVNNVMPAPPANKTKPKAKQDAKYSPAEAEEIADMGEDKPPPSYRMDKEPLPPKQTVQEAEIIEDETPNEPENMTEVEQNEQDEAPTEPQPEKKLEGDITPRQLSTINRLIKERGEAGRAWLKGKLIGANALTPDELTKQAASDIIGALMKQTAPVDEPDINAGTEGDSSDQQPF